jgi:putative restriction endonuclease
MRSRIAPATDTSCQATPAPKIASFPSRTGAYHRRCAISGTHIPHALQAVRIRPVTKSGEQRLYNGLLLRSDVHMPFDRGYLGVDPKHRLLVSPRLREDCGNGAEFYATAGEVIDLPERRADRPQTEFLEWHRGEIFKTSRFGYSDGSGASTWRVASC